MHLVKSMRFGASFVMATLAGLATSGCVPLPHSATRSPQIQGTLMSQGVAVADAKVFLASGPKDAPCSTAIITATTDHAGRFLLARRAEIRVFYAPLVAPLSVVPYMLCASHGGKTLVLHEGVAAVHDTPVERIVCDFAPFLSDQRFQLKTKQPCCADDPPVAQTTGTDRAS